MAHELAGALQQAGRIRQHCSVKKPHVYVRSKYIDVTKGRISQTCNRTAVMQKLPDFIPAFSHHLKPLMCDGSQSTCMLFHPRIDGGIPLDSAVESQQFPSHRRSTLLLSRSVVILHSYFPSFWPWSSIGSAPITVSANRITTQMMIGPMLEPGPPLVCERVAAIVMERYQPGESTQIILPWLIGSQLPVRREVVN